MLKNFTFYKDCVSHNDIDVWWLSEMIDDSVQVTRRTFLQYVSYQDELKELDRHLCIPMSRDWHVSYHKGMYNGHLCYYYCHSGIEHLYFRPDDLLKIQKEYEKDFAEAIKQG